MIWDEAEAKRWGLVLLFGGYLAHLAAALGIPSMPRLSTIFWGVAVVGAISYAIVMLRQTLRSGRNRN
jgi:hypothetical protein